MAKKCRLTYRGPGGKFIDPTSGLEWERTYDPETGAEIPATQLVDEEHVVRICESALYGERWDGTWLDEEPEAVSPEPVDMHDEVAPVDSEDDVMDSDAG